MILTPYQISTQRKRLISLYNEIDLVIAATVLKVQYYRGFRRDFYFKSDHQATIYLYNQISWQPETKFDEEYARAEIPKQAARLRREIEAAAQYNTDY